MAIHVIIIICTVYSVGSMVFWRGTDNMSVAGLVAFRYFTMDSNVLAGFGLGCGLWTLQNLVRKRML